MDFYYVDENRKRVGPVTLEEMRSHAISPETYVWFKGLGPRWKQAREVPELAELLIIQSSEPEPPTLPEPILDSERVPDSEPVVETEQVVPDEEMVTAASSQGDNELAPAVTSSPASDSLVPSVKVGQPELPEDNATENSSRILKVIWAFAIVLACIAGGLWWWLYSGRQPSANEVADGYSPQLEQLAQSGDTAAQMRLSEYYALGKGVDQNEQTSVLWLKRAAEGGHPEAQNELGKRYLSGKGVEVDSAQALRWVQAAAEHGLAAAQYNLGLFYKNEWSVAQDLFQAVKWFAKAANQNHVKAQYALAECYLNGWGVKPDREQAFKWLANAAAHGETRVQQLIDENHLTTEFEQYKRDHFQPL